MEPRDSGVPGCSLQGSQLSWCHFMSLCLSFLCGNSSMLPTRGDEKLIYFYQLFVSTVGSNDETDSEGGFWYTIGRAVQMSEAIFKCPADTDILECNDP